jgi:cyclohexadieny/prephenate dehydrogenase
VRIESLTRSADTLHHSKALGLGNADVDNVCKAVEGANTVIMLVRVNASDAVTGAIALHLKPGGGAVTYVGSTKDSIVPQVAPNLPSHIHIISFHAIAGHEALRVRFELCRTHEEFAA